MFKFIKRLFVRLKWDQHGVVHVAHYGMFAVTIIPSLVDPVHSYTWHISLKVAPFMLKDVAKGGLFSSVADAKRDVLNSLRKAVIS